MKLMTRSCNALIVIVFLPIALFGCGGTKVLKEPQPVTVTQPLATAANESLIVTLNWVVVRDGPGTWARNADWDEYLIGVKNLSGDSVELTDIRVVDSLGTLISAGTSRSELVKGTKKAKRRYKGQGLKVKAGAGMGTMMVAGAVTGVAAASLGSAVALGGGGLAAGAAAGIVLAPVLAVGGVMRGVNNSKVNNQIETRHTSLPVAIQGDNETSLDVFFPLTPSPRRVEMSYTDSTGGHTLVMDTSTSLAGLHIEDSPE